MSTVGVKYAELDRIEAEIAELLAAQKPEDTEAAEQADEARQRAQESAKATEEVSGDRTLELERFTPSESMKNLYREAAKKLHPDLADDGEDRLLRTRLMAQVNEAYAAGDEDRIRKILHEWEMSPESVKGEGVGADLVRILRQIKQVKTRLLTITQSLQELMSSKAYTMKRQMEERSAEGRDILNELASRIELDVHSARHRLMEIRSQFNGRRSRSSR
jgi:hypothetical protein